MAANRSFKNTLLWILFISYCAATFIFPFLNIPTLIYAGVVVTLGTIFAIIHGSMRYGTKGILVFIGFCLVISNILENLSIQTGFPFGFYYYTDLLDPKLFAVPLLIGPAYFATGYFAWIIANVLLNQTDKQLKGSTVLTLPLIASFIMVLWDVVMDPSSSTINHLWIWKNGGGFFGVPLTNFLGWFFTVFLFYQSFAFYLFKNQNSNTKTFPKSFWYQPTLLYMVIGLSSLTNYFITPPGNILDATGVSWSISAITESSLITSLFTMIFISILTLIQLNNKG